MKLIKVKIYPNMSAGEAQNKVNEWIQETKDPNFYISYELLIENSVIVGNHAKTLYTLLINLEEKEEGDDD
jgi:hypothetical protein